MDMLKFLDSLSRHNDRVWFNAHKSEYEEVRDKWYEDLGRLLTIASEWEPRFKMLDARTASYRIYRDTRFSLDKTPYKTHFSALLSPRGKKLQAADYYIQAGATGTESLTAGGYWATDTASLQKLRHAMVDNIEEFEAIINEPEFVRLYPHWYGPQLKTAPKGWDRNHPNVELLRLQVVGREHTLDSRFFTDPSWPEKVSEILRPIKPLVDFINYSLLDE